MAWPGAGSAVSHWTLGLGPGLLACGASAAGGEPRLNQIQVIGSHNSYHIAPAPAVLELIAASGRRRAESLDYTHPPLAEQFSQLGIRQVELDVYADPKGGLFAAPSARKILSGLGKEPGPDPDAEGQLEKPGLKVLHVPDVDFRSTAPTFVDALKQIRAWSQANRRHVPILIQVELKDDAIPACRPARAASGATEIDTVDAEILSVFRQDGDSHARPGPRPVRDPARSDPGAGLAGPRRGPRTGPVRPRQRRHACATATSKDTRRCETA